MEKPTIGNNGAVIGRPRKVVPPDAAQRVERLAAEGRGVIGIAAVLGTTREVLRRWMTDDPSLQEAFDAGRERERHELHTLMMRDARDGTKPNINAMFLLKCRHGYREGDQREQGSRINITFNLPGALSREDFMKTVVTDDNTK